MVLDWKGKCIFSSKVLYLCKASCTNVNVEGIQSLIHGKVFFLGLDRHCIEKIQSSGEIFCCKLHHKLCCLNLDIAKALYTVINISLGKVFCNFHNSLIVLFTLAVIILKCSSNFSRASRNMPRCFWYEVSETMLLLKCNGGWEIFLYIFFQIKNLGLVCLGVVPWWFDYHYCTTSFN